MKDPEEKPPLNIGNYHNCFGCSASNAAGLRMTFRAQGESLCSRLTVPDHLCGWNNMVHGGVISTILDEIMSWAAIYLLKKVILTKSMTVDFIKPVFIRDELTAQGKVLERKSPREAQMTATLSNKSGEICATAVGTFALLAPKTIIRMGILDEASLRTIMPLIDEG